MATQAAILHPKNETEHTKSRITQEGKKITYTLKVIQQPERARACGAGAKSSADRRPVDPPPVVELRIFESDLNDMHKTDITFGYNANFFLFATLEFARPIAHGRVQAQPTACPVLTGVPVAGIAYLDRPSQAGYFIFPDLSVRHEGLYRLNFNLYEELKDPKDADKGAPIPQPQDHLVSSTPSKPRAPNQYLHFRLEVKSVPFTVFSAKKFPGLAESTSLSRVVAEQGCRVRIRRDVRMRRREAKPNKEYGGYDERHMTPDTYPGTPVERPRSVSNVSIDEQYRYPTGPPRVQPGPEYGYHHPQPSPIAAAPQSHLAFGAAQPQYHAPPPPPSAHPAPVPAAYPSPHLGYAHTRQTSAGSEYDGQAPKYPQYPSPSPHGDRYEQPKVTIPANPSTMDPPSYTPVSYDQRPADPKLYIPQPQPQLMPSPRTPANYSTTTPTSGHAVEIDTSIPATDADYEDVIFDTTRRKGWLYSSRSALSKRQRESNDDEPLRNGQRPGAKQDPTKPGETIESSSGSDDEVMTYRRADGRLVAKQRVSVNSKGKDVNVPIDVQGGKRPAVAPIAV
ncbi:velvet protein [Onygenales sp. PD_12]|nr:velvet protein [Onygenales sp. PD_12]